VTITVSLPPDLTAALTVHASLECLTGGSHGMSINTRDVWITETREERAGSRGLAGRSGDRIRAGGI
jgi:hypothetical protein